MAKKPLQFPEHHDPRRVPQAVQPRTEDPKDFIFVEDEEARDELWLRNLEHIRDAYRHAQPKGTKEIVNVSDERDPLKHPGLVFERYTDTQTREQVSQCRRPDSQEDFRHRLYDTYIVIVKELSKIRTSVERARGNITAEDLKQEFRRFQIAKASTDEDWHAFVTWFAPKGSPAYRDNKSPGAGELSGVRADAAAYGWLMFKVLDQSNLRYVTRDYLKNLVSAEGQRRNTM
jgi:hypothetical protein